MDASYKTVFTESVWDFIDSYVWSEKVVNRILKIADLLEVFLEMGKVYYPDYIAAKPPFSCRTIPVADSPFVLYYLINEETNEIVIFSMQFQRADPTSRFSDLEC